MYTVTIIRLNNDTLSFQNTEVNKFMTDSELIDELERINSTDDYFDILSHMNKGDNHTFEAETVENGKVKLRFAYVFKVN